MKRTVVVGASPNASRYSYMACQMLQNAGFEFVPLGTRKGEILSKPILNIREQPAIENVHTITIYVSPSNLKGWYDYLLSLNPKRIIFNPGAYNREFGEMAEAMGIEVEYTCNLVLIQTGQF